jgi:hypothetical protein
MFWFFGKRGEMKQLKEEVRGSFDNVKKDLGKISHWISHLDGKDKHHADELVAVKNDICEIKNELNELKDMVSILGPKIGAKNKQLFKQPQTGMHEQTAVEAVQTPVQTAVQTAFLSNLSVMERAIVWTLLNNADDEMKLSYEDLAAVMGKDKSTIRGQINTIRKKSEGLIEEYIEPNGKKRVYIPDKMRVFLLKSVKVRVKSKKKGEKIEKNEEKLEEIAKSED